MPRGKKPRYVVHVHSVDIDDDMVEGIEADVILGVFHDWDRATMTSDRINAHYRDLPNIRVTSYVALLRPPTLATVREVMG